MNKRLITTINNVEVPSYPTRDYSIPKLDGIDLTKVVVIAPNGEVQSISHSNRPGLYTIRFVGQLTNAVISLQVFVYEEAVDSEDILQPGSEKEELEVPPEAPIKKRKSLLKELQKKQAERMAAKRERIKKAEGLKPKGLANLKVLTFDQTNCWARALGMLQKAKQLEYEIGKPLCSYYDRITGLGDGAIIAAAIAANLSMQDLGEWWTTEWRKVHTPGTVQGMVRTLGSFVRSNESGFNAKAARKALKKLFANGNVPMRMRDVATELHITVIQADLNTSTHQSNKHPDIELWAVCEDTAITKFSYNQKQTIKGEAIFLDFAEKNDVLGMAVAQNNEGLKLTSIGAPVRIHPESAKKLVKLGHGADKVAARDANQLVFNKRVEQVIEKLKSANHKIHYHRLECEPIDSIVLNSTVDNAMKLGIESGAGNIELPEWFLANIRKQIA
jgi:hypothetical protein